MSGTVLERQTIAGLARRAQAKKGLAPGARDRAVLAKLEAAGLQVVGRHSQPEEIEKWQEALWTAQNHRLLEIERSAEQMLLYDAGRQFRTFNRRLGIWVQANPNGPQYSRYNVFAKAVTVRVARLTANKPTLTVQAATTSMDDVDRVTYRRNLFWHIWRRHNLHSKIRRSRRGATLAGAAFLKVTWNPDAGEEQAATKMFRAYQTVEVHERDEFGQPIEVAPGVYLARTEEQPVGWEEQYVDKAGNPLGPVYLRKPSPDREGEFVDERQDPPEGTAFYREGDIAFANRTLWNVRWDWHTDDIAESWYVQDQDTLPLSHVLRLYPEALDILPQAQVADTDARVGEDLGLLASPLVTPLGSQPGRRMEKAYVVRETWIFPKDEHTRALWGPHGAIIVTVGEKIVGKPRPLPEWARKQCPFVHFVHVEEAGNHHGRPVLRAIIPAQDRINRSIVRKDEREALDSRVLISVAKGAQLQVQPIPGLPVTALVHPPQQPPQPLNLGTGPSAATAQNYADARAAAADIGSINDASQGRAAPGTAARAIFALQYADEKSVQETSTEQDEALNRLGRIIDAVCSVEMSDGRQIQIVGEDNAYMTDARLEPKHLSGDVDYAFGAGSMLAETREAVINSVLALKNEQLIDPAEALVRIESAGPESMRGTVSKQRSAARRLLDAIRQDPANAPEPLPFHDPAQFANVLQEYMLGHAFDLESEEVRAAVLQRWQRYNDLLGQMQAPQQQVPPEAGGVPGMVPEGIGGAPGMMLPDLDPAAAQLGQEAELAMSAGMM